MTNMEIILIVILSISTLSNWTILFLTCFDNRKKNEKIPITQVIKNTIGMKYDCYVPYEDENNLFFEKDGVDPPSFE